LAFRGQVFAPAVYIPWHLEGRFLPRCKLTLAFRGQVFAPAVNSDISVFHWLLLCTDLITKTDTRKNRKYLESWEI
jgi:hypothetical protein